MAMKPELPETQMADDTVLSSYIGLSFAVFLGLLPRRSITLISSLQSHARVLSVELFRAEDKLRQLQSRRADDSKANARVVEIFSGQRLAWQREDHRLRDLLDSSNSEISVLEARIDELERSEADLRASVEVLQREVSEREEMLEFMVSRQEGEDNVEGEIGEYFGDFSGVRVSEGMHPVPELEEMTLSYAKQVNGYHPNFFGPPGGRQDSQSHSLKAMHNANHFVGRRETPWKLDGESTGVPSKLKLLEQELTNLEMVGKGDLSKTPSLMRKQAKRYQSLAAKIDDLCRRMQVSDPCEATLSQEFRTQRQTEFLLEAFRLQSGASDTREKLNQLEAEAMKCHPGSQLLGQAKMNTRRSLDSIRNNFKEIQRNLEIWLARIMGDLEGILARDGTSPLRDYYISRYPFVR